MNRYADALSARCKRIKLFLPFFCSLALAPSLFAEIIVDGDFKEWRSYPALPIVAADRETDSPLGRVTQLKAGSDEDFLFAMIEFAWERPLPGSAVVSGAWDDLTYLEIDVDGDGAWDYATRMTTGKRSGYNNMLVLRSDDTHPSGRVVLHEEGHHDYAPLGPKGAFREDRRAVEMRVPRHPLQLFMGRVFIRFKVRYRDAVQGSGKWVTEYHPTNGRWIGLDLRPIPETGIASTDMSTLNRTIEPVELIDFYEDVNRIREKPRPSPYVYPTITVSILDQIEEARKAILAKRTAGEGASVESAIVIGPNGEINLTLPDDADTAPGPIDF